MIIAIDGPAASGKGTLARRLAAHYRLPHLDTGLLYRAVGAALIEAGLPLDDSAAAVGAAESIDLSRLDAAALSRHDVGEAASRVAAIPAVRAALLDRQRSFGHGGPGAVLDGRDIGTVVFPNADAKLFVTATVAERARRRTAEMASRGLHADYATILADLERRDARDSNRASAPLRIAEDAILLDTTNLDADAAFLRALDLTDAALRL
ncbi:cytidylate kinase [Pseudoxanthobacter soli DSM 19599]|uniref:Cytidylate kinase n=1 Tax=Pseudoxanthobacter soli DSM 19599 TaxID=1123029 RepID=A0A1M7ZMG4_9HYPH|nr:(d)CMP kinase [Pseudoxanthobacter soli]SHO66077.1 cytidylate kinase [Pseudoxanthobacter soli DSM 19599]